MVGTQKYKDEEVEFIIRQKASGKSVQDILNICKMKWPTNRDWSLNGVRYVCNSYRNHPQYKKIIEEIEDGKNPSQGKHIHDAVRRPILSVAASLIPSETPKTWEKDERSSGSEYTPSSSPLIRPRRRAARTTSYSNNTAPRTPQGLLYLSGPSCDVQSGQNKNQQGTYVRGNNVGLSDGSETPSRSHPGRSSNHSQSPRCHIPKEQALPTNRPNGVNGNQNLMGQRNVPPQEYSGAAMMPIDPASKPRQQPVASSSSGSSSTPRKQQYSSDLRNVDNPYRGMSNEKIASAIKQTQKSIPANSRGESSMRGGRQQKLEEIDNPYRGMTREEVVKALDLSQRRKRSNSRANLSRAEGSQQGMTQLQEKRAKFDLSGELKVQEEESLSQSSLHPQHTPRSSAPNGHASFYGSYSLVRGQQEDPKSFQQPNTLPYPQERVGPSQNSYQVSGSSNTPPVAGYWKYHGNDKTWVTPSATNPASASPSNVPQRNPHPATRRDYSQHPTQQNYELPSLIVPSQIPTTANSPGTKNNYGLPTYGREANTTCNSGSSQECAPQGLGNIARAQIQVPALSSDQINAPATSLSFTSSPIIEAQVKNSVSQTQPPVFSRDQFHASYAELGFTSLPAPEPQVKNSESQAQTSDFSFNQFNDSLSPSFLDPFSFTPTSEFQVESPELLPNPVSSIEANHTTEDINNSSIAVTQPASNSPITNPQPTSAEGTFNLSTEPELEEPTISFQPPNEFPFNEIPLSPPQPTSTTTKPTALCLENTRYFRGRQVYNYPIFNLADKASYRQAMRTQQRIQCQEQMQDHPFVNAMEQDKFKARVDRTEREGLVLKIKSVKLRVVLRGLE